MRCFDLEGRPMSIVNIVNGGPDGGWMAFCTGASPAVPR